MSDRHGTSPSTDSTVSTGVDVVYGPDVSTDAELKLCGDVRGKRIVEIGLFGTIPNCVTLARKGARVIAIDPTPERVARARLAAERAEVVVEFHTTDIVDFGMLMSGTVDLALAVHSITHTHDYLRVFRQVHRVLKPGGSFVVCIQHPVAAMLHSDGVTTQHAYGEHTPTIGELVMSLQRTNFSLDVLHELASMRRSNDLAPSILVMRARKVGS